jgi:acetolactate synthase-1/2/3 large subunit
MNKGADMIRVADFITSFISDTLSVKDVFMVAGGGIMYLTDALAQNKKIKVTCTHHEQAAAMALKRIRATKTLGLDFYDRTGSDKCDHRSCRSMAGFGPVSLISGQSKKKDDLIRDKGLRQFGYKRRIFFRLSGRSKYAV